MPTALEGDALTLLNCELVNGSSNPWHGSASLLVCPWLSSKIGKRKGVEVHQPSAFSFYPALPETMWNTPT
ncbi:hypothetical protein [uncultured Desulfovibrio sp.]|uniref:hypothetical protein n=1 Tax=uncultured Desulfovibrio sp. TaxID=167968 RepID=UPI00345BB793